MEHDESNRKSRFSRISRNSRLSSLCSPDKAAQRGHSLSRRASFIEAMQLQYPDNNNRGSGLMSDHENRFSGNITSPVFSEEYSFQPQIKESDLNRKSNHKIVHECTCDYHQCQGVHCACFLTPRQICVIGQCCPSCIEVKNRFLMATRGWQLQRHRQAPSLELDQQFLALLKQKNCKNMHYLKQIYGHQPTIQNLMFCTCKKSHCRKKYCLCFDKGVPCGQYCICLDCENQENYQDYEQQQQQRRWQRYANYHPAQEEEGAVDHDIDKYMHEELREGSFKETMQFDPPEFEDMSIE